MPNHYIRSAYVAENPLNSRAAACGTAFLFHWLRCAGWEWLWEGDGEQAEGAGDGPPYEDVNHIPDGNMQDTGVANWTVTGTGSAAKSGDQVKSGDQSLEFDADAGDYLSSDAWTFVRVSGGDGVYNPYDCVIWIYNDSGQTFTADIVGDVVWSSGPISLPSTGDWAMYNIGCTIKDDTILPFTAINLRIDAPGGASGIIYVGWTLGFTSHYEYNTTRPTGSYDGNLRESGDDGDIENGNEFSSVSYTFVGGDVGNYICCYDGTNSQNSGAYEIASISGGNAVMALRAGTDELLFNTSASDIVWRMINYPGAWGDAVKSGGTTVDRGHSGYMLQSPHSSGQRLYVRNHQAGTQRRVYVSGSPEACDFDPTTGRFYRTGRSVNRYRQAYYGESIHTGYGMFYDGFKLWAILGGDGSFLTLVHEDENATEVITSGFGIGFTGADANHIEPEDWALFHQTETAAQSQFDRFGLGTIQRSTVASFTMIDRDGLAREACMPLFGAETNTDIEEHANVAAEPFDGLEQLYTPIIWRDPDGSAGVASEKLLTGMPFLWGRPNMTMFTPFDPVIGDSDDFSLAGSTITFTAGAPAFTADMVGKEIVIAGATSGNNDGTFIITAYTSPTIVTYENAIGVTEGGVGTFTTSPRYIHIAQGMVWEWSGFNVA